jgi:hypothetical protein
VNLLVDELVDLASQKVQLLRIQRECQHESQYTRQERSSKTGPQRVTKAVRSSQGHAGPGPSPRSAGRSSILTRRSGPRGRNSALRKLKCVKNFLSPPA